MAEEHENQTRQLAEGRREVRTSLETMRGRVGDLHSELGALMARNAIPQDVIAPGLDGDSLAAQEAFRASTGGLQLWKQDVRVLSYDKTVGGGGREHIDIPFTWLWEDHSAGFNIWHHKPDTGPEKVLDTPIDLSNKCSITGIYEREHQATVRAIEAALEQAFKEGQEGAQAAAGGSNCNDPFTHIWFLELKRNVQLYDVVDGEVRAVDNVVWTPVVQLGYEGRPRHAPSSPTDVGRLTEEEHNPNHEHRHGQYRVRAVHPLNVDNTFAEMYHFLARGYDNEASSDKSRLYQRANDLLRRQIQDNSVPQEQHSEAIRVAKEEGIAEGVQSALDTIRVVDPELAGKLAERMQGGASESTVEETSGNA